jgi:hypothetical protein
VQGKQHKAAFPKEGGSRAIKLLGLIHSNIWGRAKNLSLIGMKYFLSFMDDFSRKYFCYFFEDQKKLLF